MDFIPPLLLKPTTDDGLPSCTATEEKTDKGKARKRKRTQKADDVNSKSVHVEHQSQKSARLPRKRSLA